MYFKKLLGKRLYLSPMDASNYDIYTKWMNDFRVTDGLGNTNILYSLEAEKDWLLNTEKSKEYNFSIIKLENDEIMGSCGFHDVDFINRKGTVGIFIGDENNRNKGYGQEVLNLLLDYGFNYLNFHNIKLDVFSFNDIAINAYKKVGFKECGIRHEAYRIRGIWYDEISMEILEDDYRNYKKDF